MNKKGILDRLYYEFAGIVFASLVFIAVIGFVGGVQEGTKEKTDFYSRDLANVITASQSVPNEDFFKYEYSFGRDNVRVLIDIDKQSVKIVLGNSESIYFYTVTDLKEIVNECRDERISSINLEKSIDDDRIVLSC